MAHQIFYEVSETDLLLSKCEHTGYLIGGYHCAHCKHFHNKSKKYRYVSCYLRHTKKDETSRVSK